ncbi:unnamed protein product, partial [marine sediment metagenome]
NSKAKGYRVGLKGDVPEFEWPKSMDEFRKIATWLIIKASDTAKRVKPTNVLGKASLAAMEKNRELRDDFARAVAVTYTNAISELYNTADPIEGDSRLERLSGRGKPDDTASKEPAVTYHRFIPELDDTSRGKEKKIEKFLDNVRVQFGKCETTLDFNEMRQFLINAFRPYCLDEELSLPVLYRIGRLDYPSMMFLNLIMDMGALPMISPKELAEKLRTNPIYKKDIIISRDGHTVIRVFMNDEGIFGAPMSPCGILDIYPFDQ